MAVGLMLLGFLAWLGADLGDEGLLSYVGFDGMVRAEIVIKEGNRFLPRLLLVQWFGGFRHLYKLGFDEMDPGCALT